MSETLPIPRTTVTQMVAAYRQAEVDIRAAYGLLVSTQQKLIESFDCSSSCYFKLSDDRPDYEKPERVIHNLKHAAWRAIVDKIGIRSAMSIKRAEQLNRQLEGKGGSWSGDVVEPLPEVTEENILAMLEQTFNSIPQMMEEAVKEVFDWLRPSGWRLRDYKTNQKCEWELKDKLILYCVETGYSHERPFRVSYYRQKEVTALDNVFSMLDGKGIIKTHYGPLTDAISASINGSGQTDYFGFKCFRNGNLHLKFRRMDLVAKLNAVAGGLRLKNGQQESEAA